MNSGLAATGQYDHLTMMPLEDGFRAKLSNSACAYRIDGGEWVDLPKGEYTPTIDIGHILQFKANAAPQSWIGIGTFTTNKRFNLEGNCMSMIFADQASQQFSLSGYPYAFYALFKGSKVASVSKGFLPATTMSDGCYASMFDGCTGLVDGPDLPAGIIPYYGCQAMFNGCTSLRTAPVLAATQVGEYACYNMFKGCTALKAGPALNATTLANGCYYQMYQGCSNINYIKAMFLTYMASATYAWVDGVASAGVFVKSKDAAWTNTGISGIPEGWTVKTE
jgi:hypothetical protein